MFSGFLKGYVCAVKNRFCQLIQRNRPHFFEETCSCVCVCCFWAGFLSLAASLLFAGQERVPVDVWQVCQFVFGRNQTEANHLGSKSCFPFCSVASLETSLKRAPPDTDSHVSRAECKTETPKMIVFNFSAQLEIAILQLVGFEKCFLWCGNLTGLSKQGRLPSELRVQKQRHGAKPRGVSSSSGFERVPSSWGATPTSKPPSHQLERS